METKDDKSLTSINSINLKLVFGGDPTHKPYIVDIANVLPNEMITELNLDRAKGREVDASVIGFSPRIIGAIETFYSLTGDSKRLFLPLMNPTGAFVSLQQGINRILRGAIVNQKQLDALLESVDELFKNVEKERQQGLEYVYKEKGL